MIPPAANTPAALRLLCVLPYHASFSCLHNGSSHAAAPPRSTATYTRAQIVVHVYDLIEQNEYMYPMGLGAFHSGVEVLGRGALCPPFALLWLDRLLGR